jgi:plasmid stabilization system protein ParE
VKVRFTEFALGEYDAILTYLGERSPIGAAKVRLRLDKIIADLADFPLVGTQIGHAGVRMLVANPFPYLVYYVVREDAGEVVIVDVRHGARDRDE